MHMKSAGAVLAALTLAACGSSEQPPVEQIVVKEPGEASPVSSAEGAVGDIVAAGEQAFAVCSACHSAAAGAPSGAGPNLHGVVGRKAGALEGYSYSDAMAASEITWNEGMLNAYIGDPQGLVPGTAMAAGAVSDPERRAAIVAYLATLTD